MNHLFDTSPSHFLPILEKLEQKGVQFHRVINTDILLAKHQQRQVIFIGSFHSLLPQNIGLLLSSWQLCRKFLTQNKIQILEGERFATNQKAEAFASARKLQFPVTLQAEDTYAGLKKVTVKDEATFPSSFNLFSSVRQPVILEKEPLGYIDLSVFLTRSGFIQIVKNAGPPNSSDSKATQFFSIDTIEKPTALFSNSEWQDVTHQHPQLKKIGQKLLKLLAPLQYIHFSCHFSPKDQSYSITALDLDWQHHLQGKAFKGRSSQSTLDLLTKLFFPKL